MNDLTVEILREIRDEIRSTNTRLDTTNTRLDTTNARLEATADRLDARLERLERQHVSAELHIATELVAVAAVMGEIRDGLTRDRDLRGAVADHEARIRRLEGASH